VPITVPTTSDVVADSVRPRTRCAASGAFIEG
jgi:hypothetical protein